MANLLLLMAHRLANGNVNALVAEPLAGNLFSRSCGHLETEKLLPSKIVDISGQKFGELTPIEPFFHPTRKCVAWHCLCSCGKEYDAVATDLTSGSCGHLSQSYNE